MCLKALALLAAVGRMGKRSLYPGASIRDRSTESDPGLVNNRGGGDGNFQGGAKKSSEHWRRRRVYEMNNSVAVVVAQRLKSPTTTVTSLIRLPLLNSAAPLPI